MNSNWPVLETAQSTLIGLTVLTAATLPLAVPFLLIPLTLVTLAQDASIPGRMQENAMSASRCRAMQIKAALLLLGLVSAAWSKRSGEALATGAVAVVVLVTVAYLVVSVPRHIASLDAVRQRRFVRAVPLTMIVVALFFLVNHLTGDGLVLFFVNKLPLIVERSMEAFQHANRSLRSGVRPVFYNRNALTLVLMLPAVHVALLYWPRAGRWVLPSLAAYALVALVCLRSDSSTAQAALLAGSIVFALAHLSCGFARQSLIAGFVALALLAVPLAMLPKALGLDAVKGVPPSFAQRAVMWDKIARIAINRPLLGIGVNQIKYGVPAGDLGAQGTISTKDFKAWHPHNGFLQIWLELGAVGALLFAAAGALAIRSTRHLPAAVQPAALALAAASTFAIATGWSIWQAWLLASLGFAWIALLASFPRDGAAEGEANAATARPAT